MYDTNFSNDIMSLYREVFNSINGRKVLGHMLVELGFFDEAVPGDEAEVALQNYAKHLLNRCGILSAANIDFIMEVLFKIPYNKEETRYE